MTLSRISLVALGIGMLVGGCAQILGADFDKPFEQGSSGGSSPHGTGGSGGGSSSSTGSHVSSASSSSSSGATSSSSSSGSTSSSSGSTSSSSSSTSSSSGSTSSSSSSSSSSGGVPLCQNNAPDPGETDIDCGGASCPKCALDKTCDVPADCQSGQCFNKKCCQSMDPCGIGKVGDLCGSVIDNCGEVWTCSCDATLCAMCTNKLCECDLSCQFPGGC